MDVSRLWLWLACTTAGGALYLLLRAEGAAKKWAVPASATMLVIAATAVAVDALHPLATQLQSLLWFAAAAAAIGGLVLVLSSDALSFCFAGSGVSLAGVAGMFAFAGALGVFLLTAGGAAAIAAYWLWMRRSQRGWQQPGSVDRRERVREPLLSTLMWTLFSVGLLSVWEVSPGTDGILLANQLAGGSLVFVTGLLVLVVSTGMMARAIGLVAAHLGVLLMLAAWRHDHGVSGSNSFGGVVILLLAVQLWVWWRLQSEPDRQMPRDILSTEAASRES